MHTILALLILAIPCFADQPLKAVGPTISLMEMKASATNPTPPGAAVKLVKGQLYVVACKAKCELLVFPKGSVSIEEKKGPRDITANFPGGTGDFEDRSFTDPFLYVLKATSTGPVTVEIIPVGFKERSEWVELLLDCDSGGKVTPKPTPNPIDNDTLPFTGSWQIVIVEKSEEATQARGQFFSNKELWAYITSKCVKKPKIVDIDAVGPDGKVPADLAPYISRAKGKVSPQAYVVSDKGDVLYEGTLTTPEAFLSTIKKIGS